MRSSTALAWLLIVTNGLCAARDGWAEPTRDPELSAEFLLYLLEFQDGDNGWVDPEALQLINTAQQPEPATDPAASSANSSEEPTP